VSSRQVALLPAASTQAPKAASVLSNASNNNASSSSTTVPLNYAFQNLLVSNSANTTTAATPNLAPKAADVAQLLIWVAEGEQDKAEAMIKAKPALLLHRGEVTDLSGRKFENITAFQYAVWALDWHMWTMILKYLPPAEQKAQAEQFETGAWVKTHGVTADKLIQNLVTALQKYIDNYSGWSYEKRGEHWVKQVGGAQLYLPAHVINEYCRPDRSFDSTRNFLELTLPRTRQTDQGEWFVAVYQGGGLGVTWALARGTRTLATMCCWPCRGGCAVRLLHIEGDNTSYAWGRGDTEAVSGLLAVRTDQRTKLVASLKNVNTHTLSCRK